jgi:hypothetical protein
VGLNSQGHKLKPLPSLFQLDAFTWEDSLVAVASRVVTARPGDIESWDLTLYGEAFQSLSCDPFSFKGKFLDHGLCALADNLLGPGGFISPPSWFGNPKGNEYHATVHWMSLSRRITEYG